MSSDVSRRIGEHNAGKVSSTKSSVPFKLVTREEYANKSLALKREHQIKKSGLLRKRFKLMASSSSG